MNNWQTIDKLKETDIDILLFSEEWVNEDFNPNGIRIGYRQCNNDFCSARIDEDGEYWNMSAEEEGIFPTHFHELKFNVPKDKMQLNIFKNE